MSGSVIPVAIRRRSNSLSSTRHSLPNPKRRPKGCAEHVSRLQLILATASVLIPCGILILWQQIQLHSLSQRIFNLEERLFDLVRSRLHNTRTMH
jgi:hypothetical protein